MNYFNEEALGEHAEVQRIRAKIAKHGTCEANCMGWAVFNSDTNPELDECDDCWHGATDPLTLDEIEALPEAQHELALAIEDGSGYTHPYRSVTCKICGCLVWRKEGETLEQCSGCGALRTRECHCVEPGSCDICAPVSLLDMTRQLCEKLREVAADKRDPETVAAILNLVAEAQELIDAHDEIQPPVQLEQTGFQTSLTKVLAAMNEAEGIHGPEGDAYRLLMLAIEQEAQKRRIKYDNQQE